MTLQYQNQYGQFSEWHADLTRSYELARSALRNNVSADLDVRNVPHNV